MTWCLMHSAHVYKWWITGVKEPSHRGNDGFGGLVISYLYLIGQLHLQSVKENKDKIMRSACAIAA